jgi:hypothetical protein
MYDTIPGHSGVLPTRMTQGWRSWIRNFRGNPQAARYLMLNEKKNAALNGQSSVGYFYRVDVAIA